MMSANIKQPGDPTVQEAGLEARETDTDSLLTRETLKRVIDALPVGVYVLDEKGSLVYGNDAGKLIWAGLKYVGPENFAEYKAWRLDTGEPIPAEEWAGTRAIRNGETCLDEEIEIECFDGTHKIILNSALPLHDETGRRVGAIALNRDITVRKNAEQKLKQSEERLRTTLDGMLEGVQIIGHDWRYRYINDAAEIHNRRSKDELLGKRYMDMWPGIEQTAVFQLISDCMTNRNRHQLDNEFVFPDGDAGWFNLSIQPVPEGVFILSVDITQKKRVEQTVLNNQKLEALGLLAGGIAHDFNNLLGGVYGFIELALDDSTAPTVQTLLEQSMATMDRARELTSQLITFSKGGAPFKKIGKVLPLLRDTSTAVLNGTNITLDFRDNDNLPVCAFDPNQLAQVTENIVLNAVQAMPKGGKISISASVVSLKDAAVNLPDGEYIRISFSDRGCGIPRDVLPKIFDPFFSTKEHGRGLGLAVCYSIMQRHDGALEVTSELERGTTIHVYLPAGARAAATSDVTDSTETRRQRRVLLMDDEDIILATASQMLKKLGFRVDTAKNGDTALALFEASRETKDPFSAIILDLTVSGGKGGEKTVAAIRAVDRDIPVFVASGYVDVPIMATPERFGFNGALQKPFRKGELKAFLEKYLVRSGF